MINKLLPLNQSWKRTLPIDCLIFHTTRGTSALSSWNWLDHIDLSYHYIIDDNGDMYKSVDHDRSAWHAGVVSKPNARAINHFRGVNPNKVSIGIAFSRNGHLALSQPQVEACVKLIKDNNWQDLQQFTHQEITRYKPKEVNGYLKQIQEALAGDKGEDFRTTLLIKLIAKLTVLLEQLTSQLKNRGI